MKMSYISLHAPALHTKNISLVSYAGLAQGYKSLSLMLPTGKKQLASKLLNTPLFFHNGLIGNMAGGNEFTCREALVNELRRTASLGVNLGTNTISIVRVKGELPEWMKIEELKKFIRAFVDKREGRTAYMHPLTTAVLRGKTWTITFPVSDRYFADAYTSASMLVWLLRNCRHTFNTKHNFDNLGKIVERLVKEANSINYQALILWLALFVVSKNGGLSLATSAQVGHNRGPNGPINYIDTMDFKGTMTNLLYNEGAIDRLYKLTNGFAQEVLGRVKYYDELKSYEKYLSSGTVKSVTT